MNGWIIVNPLVRDYRGRELVIAIVRTHHDKVRVLHECRRARVTFAIVPIGGTGLEAW